MHKLLLIMFLFSIASNAQKAVTGEERQRIANEIEHSIKTELLNKWYPQCEDSIYGGFITTFTFDFRPTGPQDKFIVTQSRHTWTTAIAAGLYARDKFYLECSAHG